MNASLSLRSLTLATLTAAMLVAGGCASSDGIDGQASASGPGAAPDEGEAVATEDEIRASCSNPRAYFVTFREGTGTCDAVAAHNGQWVPEPLFTDAPADVQATTCLYRWSGKKYSSPDRDTLATKVGYANGLAPACGTASTPDVGLLHPISALDIYTQVGSVGCDVCGVLRRGKLWVILPPEKIAQKQFEVRLDNGTTRAFQIEPSGARALSITLPAPPPGTRYQAGRVPIY